jgi:hypothetical protein
MFQLGERVQQEQFHQSFPTQSPRLVLQHRRTVCPILKVFTKNTRQWCSPRGSMNSARHSVGSDTPGRICTKTKIAHMVGGLDFGIGCGVWPRSSVHCKICWLLSLFGSIVSSLRTRIMPQRRRHGGKLVHKSRHHIREILEALARSVPYSTARCSEVIRSCRSN